MKLKLTSTIIIGIILISGMTGCSNSSSTSETTTEASSTEQTTTVAPTTEALPTLANQNETSEAKMIEPETMVPESDDSSDIVYDEKGNPVVISQIEHFRAVED